MKKFTSLLYLLLIFTSLLMIGCGGGGGFALPPLPVFVPDSVTETDRTAAINNISTFYGTVAGQPDAAAQVVARMKTLPQFAAAEISESGEAIGWFKDGVLYAVITSDKFRPTTSKAQKPPRAIKEAPKAGREIPGAPTAYLVNPMEEAWGDIRLDIKPILNIRGYDTILLDGTIDDFAQIHDAGLLYTHCTGFATRDRNGVVRSWYVTADQVTVQSRAKYQAQIQAGKIGIISNRDYLGPSGDYIIEDRFCVSDKYLKECGMSFAPNAAWVNESTYGARDEIFDAVSQFPNLALYGGWSGTAYGDETLATSSLIFDRMLADNAIEPVDPEDPPLTGSEMLGIMAITNRPGQGIGYDRSAAPGGQTSLFRFLSRGNKKRTLIPSIRSVEVDDDKNEMTISGYFGSVIGATTLDGSILTFKSGTEDKIIVQKPTANSGYLVVTGLGGSSASGFLKSVKYKWAGLDVKITPSTVVLQKLASQTFTVAATAGAIPAGSKYKWTVIGVGKVGGATTVTTTTPSVSYKAPNQDTSDTVKVEILSSSNAVLATATAGVMVGQSTITFTLSPGAGWPENVGTHSYADGEGQSYTSGSNHDIYSLDYDVDTTDPDLHPRASIGFELPHGTPLVAGQVIDQALNNANPTLIGFTFATARYLNQPYDGNGYYDITGLTTTGKMTILSATTNPDGSKTISYSLFVNKSDGSPAISATGSCRIVHFGP